MKKVNILLTAALVMLMASCSEEKDNEPVNPTPGKDVVFDASTLQSRTEYQQPNPDGSYPIWWLPDDQMLVMSPQCAVKQGHYEVGTTVTATGSPNAGILRKIGNAGVQWGESATADFYSVYPYKKVVEGGVKPDSKTVTMRMPHIQNDYIFNRSTAAATDYYAKADMDASFLYAQTNGVENGSDVQLGYKSLSTAIRFKLVGPKANDAESVNIQSIKITATCKIAGKMDLTFPDESAVMPTVKFDPTDSYNYVYIYSSYKGSEGGGYLTLKKGENIELNAFVMQEDDCNIENWTIEVQTLTKKYTKTLGSGNLKRGMIHNLGELPALDADNTSEWQVSNWMVNIPRNTYISEISLPGSWNSMNKEFQSITDLSAQYNIGIRAFHLDCRYNGTSSWGTITPTDLAIANGGDTYGGDDNKVMRNAPTFEYCLTTITNEVKSDEYMVVLCTFAQGSATKSGETWEQAVSNACASNEKVILGSSLSEKTVVNDVLGKVIVIVNSEGAVPNIADSKCLFVNAPLTLTADMFATSGQYATDDLHWGNTASSGLSLAVSQAQIESRDNTAITSGDRGYGPTHEQRLAQLNAILDWSKANYGSSSQQNTTIPYLGIGGYSAYYSSGVLGVGAGVKPGVPTGSSYTNAYDYIAGTYNPWIYNRIQDMINKTTNFYPVGIVLMNMVNKTEAYNGHTGINGQSTVKQILMLNNLYQKAFDPNKPAWPETGGNTPENTPANYSSSHTNGGNAWIVNQ